MGFSFDHAGIANLFGNGYNFITFSIMGMLIVFAGLSLISIYITLLPKLLNYHSRIKTEKEEKQELSEIDSQDESESELLLAVAVALHLDQANGSGLENRNCTVVCDSAGVLRTCPEDVGQEGVGVPRRGARRGTCGDDSPIRYMILKLNVSLMLATPEGAEADRVMKAVKILSPTRAEALGMLRVAVALPEASSRPA